MKLKINTFTLDLTLFFILLCPLFFYAGKLNPAFNSQRILCMHVMAVLMLACSITNRWLGGFLLLTLIHGFIFPGNTGWLDYLIPVFFGCLVYELIATRYTGKSYPWAILGVMIFNLFIAFFQWIRLPLFSQQQLEICGWMALPSFFGIYSAIAAPVLMVLHPALLILSLAGVLLSKSAFAVFALAAGSGFYSWYAYPRLRIALLILGLTGPFMLIPCVKHGFSGKEMTRRLHIWPMVASRAFRSPFIGIGAGGAVRMYFIEMGYQDKAHEYFQVEERKENEEPLKIKLLEIAYKNHVDTTRLEQIHFHMTGGVFKNLEEEFNELRGKDLGGWRWLHCHNEYLQIWLEFGFLGLALMLGYIVDLFIRFFKYGRQDNKSCALMGAFVAILILAMAHFEFYLVSTMSLIIPITAILDRRLKSWL